MRELTPTEQQVITLVKAFDYMAHDGKLVTTMYLGTEATALLSVRGIKICKSEWVEAKKSFRLTLSMHEFNKYVEMCCKKIGLTVLIDGSVMTFDKQVVKINQ